MNELVQSVQGFMYPDEVELQWSVLIVLYPFITGLVFWRRSSASSMSKR